MKATNLLFMSPFFSGFILFSWPVYELRSCQCVYSAERKALFSIYHVISESTVGERQSSAKPTLKRFIFGNTSCCDLAG